MKNKIIAQLYECYLKCDLDHYLCSAAFKRRIKKWYSFWQICELEKNDRSVSPISVSWTHLWLKYTEALRKREKDLQLI